MLKNPVADPVDGSAKEIAIGQTGAPDIFVFGQTSNTPVSHDSGIAWVSGRGGTRGSDTSEFLLSGPDNGGDYDPMLALPAFDLA